MAQLVLEPDGRVVDVDTRRLSQQDDQPAWLAVRKALHITASVCAAALDSHRFKSRAELLLEKSGLAPERSVQGAAVEYGRDHEKDAILSYMREMGQWVCPTGLYTDATGRLGASPDGLVVDEKGVPKGLVEAKCPLSLRDVERIDASVVEALRSQYNPQIQCLLACTDLPWCDLVIWSPKAVEIIRVMRDVRYWDKELHPALQKFSVDVEAMRREGGRSRMEVEGGAAVVDGVHDDDDDDDAAPPLTPEEARMMDELSASMNSPDVMQINGCEGCTTPCESCADAASAADYVAVSASTSPGTSPFADDGESLDAGASEPTFSSSPERLLFPVYAKGPDGTREKNNGIEVGTGAPREPDFALYRDEGELRGGPWLSDPSFWHSSNVSDAPPTNTKDDRDYCWGTLKRKQCHECPCSAGKKIRGRRRRCGTSLCWKWTGRPRRKSKCPCDDEDCGGGRCDATRRVRSYCSCKREGCGGGLCDEHDGVLRPRSKCPCDDERCGGSRCKTTRRMKSVCYCGAAGCGRGIARKVLNRFSNIAFCAHLTNAEIDQFLGYSAAQLRQYLLATYPGDPEVTAERWARGELQVEHIEPCAHVARTKGAFWADGNFTAAAKYVNRLANLQLMETTKNLSKGTDFHTSTASDLARRDEIEREATSFEDRLRLVEEHVAAGYHEIGDPARYQ